MDSEFHRPTSPARLPTSSCSISDVSSARFASCRSESLPTNDSPDALGLYGYTLHLSQSTFSLASSCPPVPETWTPAVPVSTTTQRTDSLPDAWPEFQPYGTLNSRSPLAWTPLSTIAVTESSDILQPVLVMPSDRSSSSSSLESSDTYSFTGFRQALALGTELKQHAGLLSQPGHGSYTAPEEHQLTISPQRLHSFTGLPHVQAFRPSSYPPPGCPASDSADTFQRERVFRSMSAPEGSPLGSSDTEQTITEIKRTRKRRRLTTVENANYQCQLCGKLFQRNYNLKTHMETHNPSRGKPNLCLYAGCGRKFVRRADLLRHEQTVHDKIRNYRCTLCDAHFARKDTLRRHAEDGCPKRFEVKRRPRVTERLKVITQVAGTPSPQAITTDMKPALWPSSHSSPAHEREMYSPSPHRG